MTLFDKIKYSVSCKICIYTPFPFSFVPSEDIIFSWEIAKARSYEHKADIFGIKISLHRLGALLQVAEAEFEMPYIVKRVKYQRSCSQ
jgi:hypothetical protein